MLVYFIGWQHVAQTTYYYSPLWGHSLWHRLMIHLCFWYSLPSWAQGGEVFWPILATHGGLIVSTCDMLWYTATCIGLFSTWVQFSASSHLKFALIHTQPSFPRMRWRGKRKKKIIFTHLLLSQTIQFVSSKACIFSPSLIDGICTLIDPLVYCCIGLHYTGIIITVSTILSLTRLHAYSFWSYRDYTFFVSFIFCFGYLRTSFVASVCRCSGDSSLIPIVGGLDFFRPRVAM